MIDNCKNADDRWNKVEKLLQSWLQERRDLLVKYTTIAQNGDAQPDLNEVKPRLQRMCEILVDYISAGHFEVFYEIIHEAESFADGSADIAKTIIPKIEDTTESALNFNDRYANMETANPDTFSSDLSNLGEVLSVRFELEDQLISKLHLSHQAR